MATRANQPPREAMTKENQWPLLSTSQGLVESGPFIMVPLAFLQHQYTGLSATEVRVMLYIFYRTLGYRDPLTGGRKVTDAISHSQFLKGIITHDDKQLDRGAGISERSLDRALDGLQEKGFIKRCRRTDRHGRQLTTMYELNLEAAGADWLQSSNIRQLVSDKEHHAKTEAITAITATSPKGISNPMLVDMKVEQSPEQTQPTQLVAAIAYPTIDEEGQLVSYVKLENNRVITPTEPALQKSASPKAIHQPNPAISAENNRNFAGVAPVKLPDTKESLNNQIINNQTQTGVVKSRKSKTAAPRSEQPLPVSFLAHQQAKTAQQALALELTDVGISRLEAQRLAAIAVSNGHQAGSYVGECLRYIQRQTGVKSRAGLLVYLIKTNWQPALADAGSSALGKPARLVESWAKYSGNTLVQDLEPKAENADLPEIDGLTDASDSLCQPAITREKCEEVWQAVCQKAVEEWGISADALAGSWLAPVQSDSASFANYLRIHLSDPYQVTAVRYKLSQLIKAALGLGPTWRIIDSDLAMNKTYCVNELAV